MPTQGRSGKPTTRRYLAAAVAVELMASDALGAHMRDELGQNDVSRARPVQAAVTSFFSFAVGAAIPLLVAASAAMAPGRLRSSSRCW